MIEITITVVGDTVDQAFANAENIARGYRELKGRRGGVIILDGMRREVRKGSETLIGYVSATADTDRDKVAHYTGHDTTIGE